MGGGQEEERRGHRGGAEEGNSNTGTATETTKARKKVHRRVRKICCFSLSGVLATCKVYLGDRSV